MSARVVPQLDEFPYDCSEESRTGCWCPNCGGSSAFSRSAEWLIWPTVNTAIVLSERCILEEIWTCLGCGKSTVVHHEFGNDVTETRTSIVWPPKAAHQLSQDVPQAVRSLYREASTCDASGARRGAAGLYGACVEALLDDRKIPKGKLMDRIDGLRDHHVEEDLITDLHEARVVGNWSLHEALEFSAEEVTDVAALIEDAVRVIYVQPAEKARMRDLRASRRAAHKAGDS